MIVSIHDRAAVRYLQRGLRLKGVLLSSIAAFDDSAAIMLLAEWDRAPIL